TLYQPVNEISFLSWAVGNTSLIHPHSGVSAARAHEAKCNLVRAAIRACDALWAVEPRARIVHTDPLIHVTHAPGADSEAVRRASELNLSQYEAWDMLAGRSEPGLGGAARYLDILGVNYYHSNQWEHPSDERLHWHRGDPRRVDLADMIETLWRRYERPIFIAETGHVGDGRAIWLDEVATAALRCRARAVPLHGICLYPLVDRPDWQDLGQWHHSGLWDVPASPTQPDDAHRTVPRLLNQPYAQRLAFWQTQLDAHVDAAMCARAAAAPAPSFINPSGSPMSHLIAFSHLRWDFVYQRPQHLLSRLARRFPVIFVEEPVPNAAHCSLERLHPCEGVEVLRPHLTGTAGGFHDDHIPVLQEMLSAYLREQGIDRYALWFYTPMALPLAASLSPEAVIYDCMDELAAFKHAPRQLLQRESALLKMADLVFTGGMSLYEAKRERRAQVHCFPSSVDAAHFAPRDALQDDLLVKEERRPRIGYYGVIDERLDLPLVRALAASRPEWDFIMVGPVVKIDPATLPQGPNIEWMGQRGYDELPRLVAGWDVCLLPFALNESTRFISPTKTLEYLAAGKPAISTPIHDVVRSYAGVVAIASTAQEFAAACEAALSRTEQERALDALARAEVVSRTSWDVTVDAMSHLVEAHLKAAQPAAHSPSRAQMADAAVSEIARAA
ncbi:MAG: glycosyl transferase group 1, partial [Variovorax sp.]|nr:glycosyl transferase group 1 [Variovorax sp.]